MSNQQHPSFDRTSQDAAYARQRDIIPPDRIAEYRATVIGVGAAGRQVAIQLTAMGMPWLQLVDFDVVEAVNLGPQGFYQDDIGRPKVEAVAEICQEMNHQVEVDPIHDRFRRSINVGDVVFCCVDDMNARRHIWKAVEHRVDFFGDIRMTAEVLRVLVAINDVTVDAASSEHYPTTLFRGDQAYRGACTAKSTIFCANIAAGLLMHQFSRWLRRLPVDVDQCMNLLAGEWDVGPIGSNDGPDLVDRGGN